ncbi:MAG TPA: DUF4886 domain-containing protein [Prosthecobacter sp.]|nr:DUF4886 domain-containing protein [Prosthecobacter sp.]
MIRLLPCLLFLTSAAFAAEPAVKTVRLLNIGNSFSGNATRYLGDLAKAAGHTLVHHQASIGGSTMQQHWDKAQLHEANPQDPRGFYATKLSLRQELQAEPWDFVTIQQASIRSHDISTYRPFAAQLRDYVKRYAPTAQLLLHQTWAYRRDDPRFSPKNTKAGEPLTRDAMHEQLTRAYRTIAAELQIPIIPTGDAFHLADTDPESAYVPDPAPFDPKTAKAPALPNQKNSLHVGWTWKKPKTGGAVKLNMDGHHANTAGEYLGACVFYEVLFKESVIGNAFVPKGLDPARAAFLQKTAHKAVQNQQ